MAQLRIKILAHENSAELEIKKDYECSDELGRTGFDSADMESIEQAVLALMVTIQRFCGTASALCTVNTISECLLINEAAARENGEGESDEDDE